MDFTATAIAIRLAIGVVIGFTIGMTGIGGGVLVLPALTILLGMPPSMAVGTASLYASVTQVMASFHHYKLKNINFPAAGIVLAFGIPAAAVTGILLNQHALKLKGDLTALASYEQTRQVFIGIVIIAAAVMLISDLLHKSKRHNVQPTPELEKIKLRELPGSILLGLTIGFLIASTSVGGGVITIPLLIIIFKLPAARSVGTSSLITLFLTATTSFIYGKGGILDIPTALIMAGGSISGVYAGSKLTAKLPEKVLQGIIIGIIIIAAIAMIFEFQPSAPPSETDPAPDAGLSAQG